MAKRDFTEEQKKYILKSVFHNRDPNFRDLVSRTNKDMFREIMGNKEIPFERLVEIYDTVYGPGYVQERVLELDKAAGRQNKGGQSKGKKEGTKRGLTKERIAELRKAAKGISSEKQVEFYRLFYDWWDLTLKRNTKTKQKAAVEKAAGIIGASPDETLELFKLYKQGRVAANDREMAARNKKREQEKAPSPTVRPDIVETVATASDVPDGHYVPVKAAGGEGQPAPKPSASSVEKDVLRDMEYDLAPGEKEFLESFEKENAPSEAAPVKPKAPSGGGSGSGSATEAAVSQGGKTRVIRIRKRPEGVTTDSDRIRQANRQAKQDRGRRGAEIIEQRAIPDFELLSPEEKEAAKKAEKVAKGPYIRVTMQDVHHAKLDGDNLGIKDAEWFIDVIDPESEEELPIPKELSYLEGHPLMNYIRLKEQVIPVLKKIWPIEDDTEIEGVVDRTSRKEAEHYAYQGRAMRVFLDLVNELKGTDLGHALDEAARRWDEEAYSSMARAAADYADTFPNASKGSVAKHMMDSADERLKKTAQIRGVNARLNAVRDWIQEDMGLRIDSKGRLLPVDADDSFYYNMDSDPVKAEAKAQAVAKGYRSMVLNRFKEAFGVSDKTARKFLSVLGRISVIAPEMMDKIATSASRDRTRSKQFTDALNTGNFVRLHGPIFPFSKRLPLWENGEPVLHTDYAGWLGDVGLTNVWKKVSPTLALPYLDYGSGEVQDLLSAARNEDGSLDLDNLPIVLNQLSSEFFKPENMMEVQDIKGNKIKIPNWDMLRQFKSLRDDVARVYAQFADFTGPVARPNAKGKIGKAIHSSKLHNDQYALSPFFTDLRAQAANAYPEFMQQLDKVMDEYGAADFTPTQKELERIVAHNEALLDKWVSDLSHKINVELGGRAGKKFGLADDITGLTQNRLKKLTNLIYDDLTRAVLGDGNNFSEFLLTMYPDFYKSVDGEKRLRLEGALKDKLIGADAPYGRSSLGLKNLVLRTILGKMIADPSRSIVDEKGNSIFDLLLSEKDDDARKNYRAIRDGVLFGLAGRPPVRFDEESGVYIYDPPSDKRIKRPVKPRFLDCVTDDLDRGTVSDFVAKEPSSWESWERRRMELIGGDR